MRPRHSSWLRVVWASRATGVHPVVPPSRASRSDLVLDQADRLGGHGHGADRLLVAGVADVEDGVALAAADLELVVDLGHQRADGVDHHAALGPGRVDHLGRRSVGAEHERGPGGTSSTSSTKITPWARNWSTTCRLWTISW
jgi:hypothetical protein